MEHRKKDVAAIQGQVRDLQAAAADGTCSAQDYGLAVAGSDFVEIDPEASRYCMAAEVHSGRESHRCGKEVGHSGMEERMKGRSD